MESPSVPAACPDGGTCHHACVAGCFRVSCCAPLSGVFPDDVWPAAVVADNAAARAAHDAEAEAFEAAAEAEAFEAAAPHDVWSARVSLRTPAGALDEETFRALLSEQLGVGVVEQVEISKLSSRRSSRSSQEPPAPAGGSPEPEFDVEADAVAGYAARMGHDLPRAARAALARELAAHAPRIRVRRTPPVSPLSPPPPVAGGLGSDGDVSEG